MATIYDSNRASDIPGAPDGLVFAYSDGLYEQVAEVQGMFPSARVITISAIGQASSDVVDVESGCVWPISSGVAYVRRERAAGRDPAVYCGRALWPQVIAAFDAAGMPQPLYITAHYIGPHLCSGSCYPSSVGGLVAVATQHGGDLPGHYDVTITNGTWPGGQSPQSGNSIPLETDMPLTADDIPIIQQALATMQVSYQGADQSFAAIVSSTRQRAEDACNGLAAIDPVVREAYNNAVWANTKLDALTTLITDPTGILTRLAQIQAALAALPAGTTTADPAAAKAMADIGVLASGFASIAAQLGASS